ncbi:MAG: phosphocholine cytidylyltransferase family protein [Nitrosomonadaceae bacterium]|nr:phosphocholine cytidylyltransferase family protein [Nitrosomonadaceae bacterium]
MLSAGQGRRLLPLTKNSPKCLLPVSGKPIIEWQIDALLTAGIKEIIVVTGFQTNLVEKLLQKRYPDHKKIRILFNPFFEVADNLASCWVARSVMDGNFLLLNGDTIFDVSLLKQVLKSKPAPITLSIDYKKAYDADDMKVQLDNKGLVKHVNKILPEDQIDAESIGLIYFRSNGPILFRDAVEDALRYPTELKSWYLTIIDKLAGKNLVNVCSISGHRWCEIDYSSDLTKAQELFCE